MDASASSARGRRPADLLAPCASAAEESSAAGQQRAFLDLVVNGVPKGEVFVLVRGTEVWIDAAALGRAGVHNVEGDREEFEGREVIRLGLLAPRVRYELDERNLAVRIDVDPALLERQVVQLRSVRPADRSSTRRDTSGFLNYGLNWTSTGERLVGLEAGVSLGSGLFSSYFTSSHTLGNLRGPTSVTFDRREQMQRWIAGDAVAATGTLGASMPIAGLTISRDYDLDPYFIRFPTVGLSGSLTAPATLDIYVNDRLIKTEQMPPGTFTLNDLPIPAGAGAARVVVRDAFGRQQEIGGSYYVTTSLLQRGLQQYQVLVRCRAHQSHEHELGVPSSCVAGDASRWRDRRPHSGRAPRSRRFSRERRTGQCRAARTLW